MKHHLHERHYCCGYRGWNSSRRHFYATRKIMNRIHLGKTHGRRRGKRLRICCIHEMHLLTSPHDFRVWYSRVHQASRAKVFCQIRNDQHGDSGQRIIWNCEGADISSHQGKQNLIFRECKKILDACFRQQRNRGRLQNRHSWHILYYIFRRLRWPLI